MIRRLFLDHPRSVGESYGQHFIVAARFGGAMLAGGIGALIHAIFPSLCVNSGSNTVRKLYTFLESDRKSEG